MIKYQASQRTTLPFFQQHVLEVNSNAGCTLGDNTSSYLTLFSSLQYRCARKMHEDGGSGMHQHRSNSSQGRLFLRTDPIEYGLEGKMQSRTG